MGLSILMSADPYISILIPTGNNEKDLIDCLDSIGHLDYTLDRIEVIIWDNNSQKESKDKVKKFLSDVMDGKPLQVKLIEHDDNYGVYTSRDELFKRISPDAEFALSIDDDVLLPPQLFKELLPVFQRGNSIGIIGPRTVFDFAPSETAHGAGMVNMWIGRYTDVDAQEAMECDYVIGCCMLVRSDVIRDLGGFDRDYYTSHGEVDFCLKAKTKGYKTLYYPRVKVRHRVERTGTKTPERTYYVFRNKLLVIKKNFPFPQRWISLTLYLLFWLPKSMAGSIVRNRGFDIQEIKIILKAMTDGWLNRTGRRM